MKYAHVVQYVGGSVWAILPEKMAEILAVLAFRAGGGTFTPDEIRARIGAGGGRQDPTARGSVAVIPLQGVVAHRMSAMEESSGGLSSERFARTIRAAAADDSIGTIIIDTNSPGGTVGGVLEAADAVFEARASKHVIAVANTTMASAAYWIASQASEIVAVPSAMDTAIGSIGVFAVHQDLSAALEKEGVSITLIKAGERKAEGNPFEPLSDETRAHMQASVDAAKATFVKAVARGRGVSPADVVAHYGDGRAFTAKEALRVGLIDRIAPFDAVLTSAMSGRRRPGVRASEDHWRSIRL